MKRWAIVVLALLGCKSADQKRRELNLCIVAGTDERRGYTDPLAVGWCLDNRYGWSSEDVQEAEVQIAVIERQIRASRDSARRRSP